MAPRFTVGDSVRPTTVGIRKYCTQLCTIQAVSPHPGGVTSLDEYLIRFENGDETTCCSFQIEAPPLEGTVEGDMPISWASPEMEGDRL
jgi:hypothetical protein